MVSIARLSVVKQSSFGLPGQYGRRVTRVNGIYAANYCSKILQAHPPSQGTVGTKDPGNEGALSEAFGWVPRETKMFTFQTYHIVSM